jgi:hypothetical protein
MRRDAQPRTALAAGHCDLCHKPTAKLTCDHDHVLEELDFPPIEQHRGWLCASCNIRLGAAGDTPEAIKRLIDRGDTRELGPLLTYASGQHRRG